MVITFCGHSILSNIDVEMIKTSIKDIVKNFYQKEPITFYLGGYGDFDNIAKAACLGFKKEHPNCSLIFITPYIEEDYLKSKDITNLGYDEIMYPHLEEVPKRFAIVKRNEWMIDNSDLLIAYIDYSIGGAYKTFEYAQKQKINTINLGHFNQKI